MEKLSFNELHEEIMLREFPLGDSIYEFLHPDRERALKSFAKLVISAVRKYDYHYPVHLWATVNSNVTFEEGYTFFDNFEGYRLGNIKEEDITLIPEAIAVVKSTQWATPTTANNFQYHKPKLWGVTGLTRVKYYANHPVYYELSPDGEFTEDSYVYYVNNRDEAFINLVALTILTYLKNTRDSVQVPTGLNFFDFSNRIAELTQQVNEDFSTSAEIYEMYGGCH